MDDSNFNKVKYPVEEGNLVTMEASNYSKCNKGKVSVEDQNPMTVEPHEKDKTSIEAGDDGSRQWWWWVQFKSHHQRHVIVFRDLRVEVNEEKGTKNRDEATMADSGDNNKL
ncbi:hypothetical protein E3N88_24187 [Mikania micrantha]|uniref:Uncharacterized protein n=1 Tax=Mikania micrantha TaxID=192012 RepID=A0A5N6NFA9_9ASTR|nr:hypothetical protein E3N88_24187 [Mikania micrantha]